MRKHILCVPKILFFITVLLVTSFHGQHCARLVIESRALRCFHYCRAKPLSLMVGFRVPTTTSTECYMSSSLAPFSNLQLNWATINRRDDLVAKASASQSVDLGVYFPNRVILRLKKNGIHSFPAWRSAQKGWRKKRAVCSSWWPSLNEGKQKGQKRGFSESKRTRLNALTCVGDRRLQDRKVIISLVTLTDPLTFLK